MTRAQRNTLRTIDNKKLKYERVYYKQIRKVLHQQTMKAIDYITMTGNTNLNTDMFFHSSDLQKTFVSLYKTVGVDFAEWQSKQLKSSGKEYKIKEDPFILAENDELLSYWEQEMLNYANSAGGRIASITSTNKALFQKELKKIIATAAEEGLGIEQVTRLIQKDLVKNISKQQIWQSRRIAQTEVLGAANKGQFMGAKELGILQMKIWSAILDGKTREAHYSANNQQREMNSDFNVGGEQMRWPGDVTASAANVVNCRCMVIYRPLRDDEGFAISI